MQILTTALFAITVLTATMPGGRLVAQDSNNLVGTWKLVSASTSTAKGEKNDNPYGQNPVGFLTYTADGRMSVIITEDARKPLSVADRVAAPVEERAAAFATLLAYAGRYTLGGDKVIHHVEAASIPNWVGMDLVRTLEFRGEQLILRTPPITLSAKTVTAELVWKRVNQ